MGHRTLLPWSAHLPPGTDPASIDLVAGRSLIDAWTSTWAAHPAAPVVHDDDHGWWTADQLEDATRRFAGRLRAAGVEPGHRVLLSATPSVDLVVAHVAALRAGAIVLPANTAYRERELAHLVHDARPTLALVDDAERGRWLEAAEPARPVAVSGVDGAGLPRPTSAAATELDRTTSDSPALLAYTSGTTGAPKGALLTHGNLLASAEALRIAWRWTPSDVLVLPLPLFHLHGLGVGLHGTLTAGAAVAIRPTFAADDALDAVGRHGATLLFGVPTIWSRLAATGRLGDLRRLRLGVSGSAPLPAELHRAIADASGHALIERYGMTETVMLTSNPYDGDRRPGTVGFALPGVEVRLAAGTDEIEVRGPNVMAGYRERPEANAESFRDGWFATGDVGEVDDAGYLRIVGRRKELIISGGYNVYPREVEDVLRSHPAVGDVAVVGVEHPDWGEQVVAVLEASADGPCADAELTSLADDQLAAYKRPKRLVWTDALPRNAMGKVVRSEVVAQLGSR